MQILIHRHIDTCTGDKGALLADLIRWTVAVMHPPAKTVHGDVYPRCMLVKWFLLQA